MSILSTIMHALVHHASGEAEPPRSVPRPAEPAQPTEPAQAPNVEGVDVEQILDKLAEQNDDENLDWRESIVDLLKLLNLDSSLPARKQLAEELGYDGPPDTAHMNVWLHARVMDKLAENGGKVPDSLRSV
jgi:hypothetical protein